MSAKILTITLNPSLDKTAVIPRFQIGEENRVGSITSSAGGKGINVSRALRCLGVKSVAGGLLAGAIGTCIEQELRKERLVGDFLFISGESRTNLTIIDARGKYRTSRIIESGPKVSLQQAQKFYKKFERLIGKFEYLVISGSQPAGLSDSFYGSLIRLAGKYGVKAVLDTSGKALRASLSSMPFMVKPNLSEAQDIVRKKLDSFVKIKEAARYFHSAGAGIAVITAGSRGAVAFDGKETLLAVPEKTGSKYFVGCGDAFLAGFVFSLTKGKDLAYSLRMASACGAANTLSGVPGLIKRESVNAFMRKVKIKEI